MRALNPDAKRLHEAHGLKWSDAHADPEIGMYVPRISIRHMAASGEATPRICT